MNGDRLLDQCPVCGQASLVSHEQGYACSSCKSVVIRKRWLGLLPSKKFVFQTIGPDYQNAQSDLVNRSFTHEQLAAITGTCYTDADLASIAAGDPSRLRPPTSTLASVVFGQSQETCHVQINGLIRAEGPQLSNGIEQATGPVDRRLLTIRNQGNLFISDQRIVFPSGSHTTIRIDRKLSGVRTYTDAFAVQREGEETATYFLGCEARHAALVAAYLQGRLNHLR